MSKIRKILENYANGYFAVDWDSREIDKELSRHIEERWFGKLEKELQRLMTKAVSCAFKNAEEKLYTKANREGIHTE